jgi:hypothetical protein
MAISKRDVEIAALRWKNIAESAQTRVEELGHAMNSLVNDAVVWFAHQTTSDGARHVFGIGVAFDLPIKNPTPPAEVENLPLIFWKTTWPGGQKFLSADRPTGFQALKAAVMGQGEDLQMGKELAELIDRVSDEWEAAYRYYLTQQETPVVQ